MKTARAKYEPAEDKILLKLHHGERLAIKDHQTLAKMYSTHGAASVYLALKNLTGTLPHIRKELARAAKKHGEAKKTTGTPRAPATLD